MLDQPTFDKGGKAIQWVTWVILPTNKAARHPYEKNEFQLTCKSIIYRKIHLKWAIDLNVRLEIYIFY